MSPLLLLTVIKLRRGAGREPQRDVIDSFVGQIPVARALTLILIPLAAIATYAPFRWFDLYPATNILLYVLTMPLGFWFFFRAVWHAVAHGRQEIRSPDEHGAAMPS